jgi:hypothetical protein
VKLINGAVIKYPTQINQELVTALLTVNTIDLSNTPQLLYWIQKIIVVEEQTLTSRLHDLNILINSLKHVAKQVKDNQSKAYLNGLNSQFSFSMHETLDLVEWLCESNYYLLELNLKKQFDICRLEHGWKSSFNNV